MKLTLSFSLSSNLLKLTKVKLNFQVPKFLKINSNFESFIWTTTNSNDYKLPKELLTNPICIFLVIKPVVLYIKTRLVLQMPKASLLDLSFTQATSGEFFVKQLQKKRFFKKYMNTCRQKKFKKELIFFWKAHFLLVHFIYNSLQIITKFYWRHSFCNILIALYKSENLIKFNLPYTVSTYCYQKLNTDINR